MSSRVGRRAAVPVAIRVAAVVAAAVVAAVAIAACAGPGGSASPSLSPTASILPPASTGMTSADASAGATPSASALPSDAAGSGANAVSSPVVGVVVAIDSTGLGSVSGFTLRLPGGQEVRFKVMGALENAAQFPLGHLAEHLATAAPVRVSFSRSGDQLVVYRIEDAG